MEEATVKRASLAQEVKEGNVSFPTSPTNPDNILNMEKGTTFAARARAAELNSARAAATAAAKGTMRGCEADEIPDITPVSLGSLKFTLPRRRESAKVSRSHSQAANPADIHSIKTSTEFNPPNVIRDFIENPFDVGSARSDCPPLDIKELQPAALSRQTSVLDQQAIRQKVREVSARQQSVHDNKSEDGPRAHVLPGSPSVSSYSSPESKLDQFQGLRKAELNTQHIREIRREAEKQRQVAESRSQNPALWNQYNVLDENQRLGLHSSEPPFNHLSDGQQIVRPDNVVEQPQSRFEEIHRTVPLATLMTGVSIHQGTSLETQKAVSSSNKGQGNVDEISQNRILQPLSPPQYLTSKLNELGDDMFSHTDVAKRLDGQPTSYASPRTDNKPSGQVSIRLAESSVSNEHQQIHGNLIYHQVPSASEAESPGDAQYRSLQAQDPENIIYGTKNPASSNPRSSEKIDLLPWQPQEQTVSTESQSQYGSSSVSTLFSQSRPTYTQQTQNSSVTCPTGPKAMEKFTDISPKSRPMSVDSSRGYANQDPFIDIAHSSSTVTPTLYGNHAPAQLRASSPALVPSVTNVELGFNPSELRSIPLGQSKTSFPSVKGTERRHQSKSRSQLPYLPPGTWDHSKGRFNTSTTSTANLKSTEASSFTKQAETHVLRKLSGEIANSWKKAQVPTSSAFQTSLRDPMPYTGFSSGVSKRDQLLGHLQKTIDEATAKGDLPTSNRSVLFDPVASVTAAGQKYSSSSNAGASSNTTGSNQDGRRQKAEVLPFDSPKLAHSSRAAPEYDPNILKDSDPLPRYVGLKKIETKALSSPEEGYGYRSHTRHRSAVAPRSSLGLNQGADAFQGAEISNHDGFWNDSLAVNSGNALVEGSVKRLTSQHIQNGLEQFSWAEAGTQAVDLKTNPWIEEQKCFLHPKCTLNMEQLNDAAREWFDSGKGILEDNVKDIIQRSEGLSPFASGSKYWEKPRSQSFSETQQSEYNSKFPGSRYAPIGSERDRPSYNPQPLNINSVVKAAVSDEEIRKRAAIDIMASVLANLASYHGGENPGPHQRYSQPPAWCIDHSDAGRKSFFHDNWGDVPKRVGRDPRYQKTIHEGRTTYFEDPNAAGRRDLHTYKTTSCGGRSVVFVMDFKLAIDITATPEGKESETDEKTKKTH